MKTTFLLIVLLALGASSAFAADPKSNPNGGGTASSEERNHDESWYWGFNLGGGKTKYTDSTLQAAADHDANLPGVSHATVYFDVYFMWPLENKQTALGVSLGGVNDAYSVDSNNSTSVTASLLAFTAQHWFSSNIGDGFFGRGDIGFASSRATDKTLGITTESDTKGGMGLRLGVGYSILLSNETRLPLMIQWQHAGTSDRTGSNAVIFSAGLLF